MIKLAILDKNRRVEFLNELNRDEMDSIYEHCDRIYRFEKQTEKFQILKKSYTDFKKATETAQVNVIYSRLILEFLSAFRALLDQWETELKRDFGKRSKQIELFKKMTSEEYDSSFSYRFISGLRNYTQHINNPNIRVESFINKDGQIETKLLLTKKELIENFDDWKPVIKDDFKTQPYTIDLIPIIDEVYESIKNIDHIAINQYDIPELVKSCNVLINLKNQRNSIEGELVIIEFEKLDNVHPLKIDILPLNIAYYVVNHITVK